MHDPGPQSTDPSRWALVTGASSGIGREFCVQLAARGYHLALVARRADLLHALASELRHTHGTACLVLPTDLASTGACQEIERRLRKAEIEVEFLVNNAGYGLPGRFTEPTWPEHDDFIRVMVTAVCELTRRLLPGMQARGAGYIVNVASVAGLVPGSEGHTLYGAAKSFLIRFSESLALENRPRGVNVSVLCPGFTYSEFHDVAGTRDLVRRLPALMWQDATDVVRYGIESVLNEPPRVVAIPGRLYRTLVGLNRFVPGFGRLSVKRMSKRFRHLK
ncbi:MAG: SDR family NAD(P)-dependent oxidoreductase [Xanthomonadales bacterium]|nr:SDR family NAD(P)-dependent oxidoreductase [Xanthomonadales bacterium]NIN59404.1 SDR family NAD(P)-dependent oxidoreductase [Xanthomonadales bacterium]NIN74755.1 SDR family NAD(P)-dependent oxidoreductase [Xanthomonadales bacterium]NIO14891.1 SDR family NAD(P)-dependent oxidoreductase [Xanthomonadales bacterium]NIP11797.1 SDR family NAD(P)-dependent oxidoreductase [Xanthomonadales bacterium]